MLLEFPHLTVFQGKTRKEKLNRFWGLLTENLFKKSLFQNNNYWLLTSENILTYRSIHYAEKRSVFIGY